MKLHVYSKEFQNKQEMEVFTHCTVKFWSSLTQQDEDAITYTRYSGKMDNFIEIKSTKDPKKQKTRLVLEAP